MHKGSAFAKAVPLRKRDMTMRKRHMTIYGAGARGFSPDAAAATRSRPEDPEECLGFLAST